MRLLRGKELTDLLASEDDSSLFIDPILDDGQLDQLGFDLRLGYDFLVGIRTRFAIAAVDDQAGDFSDPRSFFRLTRRDLGDRFTLHPGQTVLATSLEYFSLPELVTMQVVVRSSYARLGVHAGVTVQPGFRGCIPLELHNIGTTAVELVVGSRLLHGQFLELDGAVPYGGFAARKYLGQVRPTASRAPEDKDMSTLRRAVAHRTRT